MSPSTIAVIVIGILAAVNLGVSLYAAWGARKVSKTVPFEREDKLVYEAIEHADAIALSNDAWMSGRDKLEKALEYARLHWPWHRTHDKPFDAAYFARRIEAELGRRRVGQSVREAQR